MKNIYGRMLIIIHSIVLKLAIPGRLLLEKIEKSLNAQKNEEGHDKTDRSDSPVINTEKTIVNTDMAIIGNQTIDSYTDNQVQPLNSNTDDGLLQTVAQPANEAESDIIDYSDNKDMNNLFHYEDTEPDEGEDIINDNEKSGIVVQHLSMSAAEPAAEVNVALLERETNDETDTEDINSVTSNEIDTSSEDYSGIENIDNENIYNDDDGDGDDLSNLFGSFETDTNSPRSAFIATLPVVSGQELLEESEYLKSIIRRWQN